MALTYDYTTVKDIHYFDDAQHKEASRFAWILMAIDMNEVTEKNVDEIVFRLLFARQCGHDFLNGKLTKGSMKAVVKMYIGYKTNVRSLTRNAYIKKIAKIVTDNINRMSSLSS